MATLPSAETTVQQTAGVIATGLDLICLMSPCGKNDDLTPRRFGSAADIHAMHGYCAGVEYAAFHIQETRKPVLFVGLPIAVPGTIQREDVTGNSGSSATTLSAGGAGVLGEHDGIVRVKKGGTVGTSQIVLEYSLDGRKFKTFRLGTGSTFAVPYVNVTMTFGAGTLIAGDTIHTWHGSDPLADSDAVHDARVALAASMKDWRTAMLFGDLRTVTEANAVRDEINAYETENQRFKLIRASVFDQAPATRLQDSARVMQGAPALTFDDNVGGDTITRDSGSWLDDGFRAGDVIEVDGSASNDGTYVIEAPVTNSVLKTSGLTDEVSVLGVAVTAHTGIVFDDSSETVTRNRGSWVSEGFRAGDSVTITGTAGATNDGTFAVVTATDLVLTLAAGAVDADETIGANDVTLTNAGAQSKAAWMAEVDDEFGGLDGEPRISLSAGRARKTHPFSGWYMRRPAMWGASLREYKHDLHVATWRKSDGVNEWDLNDADGNLAEWDDRVDGEAGSAARFTTYRTWANGPEGCFVALDLTRAGDSSILQLVSKENVVNLACQVVQLNTETAAIGVDLVLNGDGTATKDSLATIEQKVNRALDKALLQNNKQEGPRASRAVWGADPATVMTVPEPEIIGALDLLLNGTVFRVRTAVRIQSGS